MVRTVRLLLLAGIPFLAFGELETIIHVAFICFDMCPPESDLASSLATRLTSDIPDVVPGALLVLAAWICCLVALARAGRRGQLAAVALALPLTLALSVGLLLTATHGKLLPTTWLEHNAGWDAALDRSAAVILLWPFATLLATFALPRRREERLLQHGDGEGERS